MGRKSASKVFSLQGDDLAGQIEEAQKMVEFIGKCQIKKGETKVSKHGMGEIELRCIFEEDEFNLPDGLEEKIESSAESS